jgi:hypothetical protein
MPLASLVRGIGNKIYDHAFPIYRLCYRAFKAYADREEQQLLKRILFAGNVVVDEGANIAFIRGFPEWLSDSAFIRSSPPRESEALAACDQSLANVSLSQAAVGESSGSSGCISDQLNVVIAHTPPRKIRVPPSKSISRWTLLQTWRAR